MHHAVPWDSSDIVCYQRLSICTHPPVEPSEPMVTGLSSPLSTFDQRIQSSVHDLAVAANEKFDLPVRIENPGIETWTSVGSAPVNVSYKWFKDKKILPIEGDRTPLPKPIDPKASADMILHIVAPNQAENTNSGLLSFRKVLPGS